MLSFEQENNVIPVSYTHLRLIDIDILLYGDLILHTPELEIPHPLMTERRFVMDPLAEIASDVVHPVLGKRLGEL